MQIDRLRIMDVVQKDNTRETEGSFSDTGATSAVRDQAGELRAIQIDDPFYHKEGLREQTVSEGLEKQLRSGMSAAQRRNGMAVYTQTTSERDLRKMAEEGFDPMEMDTHTIVTVTDRIKVALAKGGADISAMGGVSDAVAEELSGSRLEAGRLEAAIEGRDLPADESCMEEAMTAVRKVEELPSEVSEESARYLLHNELEPTIGNLYQASYATGSGETEKAAVKPMPEIPEELRAQMEDVIRAAGQEVTEESIENCRWLLENRIPVTPDNLNYLSRLKETELVTDPQETAERIADAVAEGKRPEDALMIPEYDLAAKARKIVEDVLRLSENGDLSDLKARRTIEEARLLMSVEANYRLLKQGIAIDVMPMEDVVEALKKQEEELLKAQVAVEDETQTEQNGERCVSFFRQTEELAQMPAAALGRIKNAADATIGELLETARPLKDAFEAANERYETMRTQIRTDLGDSMKKAFANVDDILADLGMDLSEANRRAVRILAYNQTELTPENILRIKAQDAQVQKLFKSMTPSVVTDMIRAGENPLDRSIGELTDMAQQFGEGKDDGESAEDFAKFLWKAEQNGELTPEQRESYIGIYRLIHQVEKGDGAAIGALMAQGAEVTLRNLMTAVRSGKRTGREYAVDDSFGGLSDLRRALSVTEQIEAAYQKDCLSEAGREMTPVKMMRFESEDAYMEMSPEQFRDSLVSMNDIPEVAEQEEAVEEAYYRQKREELGRALASEEQAYEILERYDLPETPAFLQGISEMLYDRNRIYRNLNRYAKDGRDESGETTISDLMEDLIEDFGEALKTPEDMAEAQRRLEETAENVMKNMLVEKDVASIDLRGMKLVLTQIKAMGQMSERSSTYHLPIIVEDQIGNLTLKIVNGEDKKGLVDVAMDMEATGSVRSSFRYEKGGLSGELSFARQDVLEKLAAQKEQLAERMERETGLSVSLSFAWDKQTQASGVYFGEEGTLADESGRTADTEDISTKALYGAARSFIGALTEILS